MDDNVLAFLALLRGGLWEEEVLLAQYPKIDFGAVYTLAEEQAVVGLIAAGMEHVKDVTLPKDFALKVAGYTLQLEQRNSAMNGFIATLMGKMNNAGIYALLVKGQGIAQCYQRPLWRAPGDVDLFLNETNYNAAKSFFPTIASSIKPENPYTKHLGMTVDSWEVELHGNMRANILNRMDEVIDAVQEDTFVNKKVRIWRNGSSDILLPSPDNDLIFIFTHILHHFYRGGIGLRQICDWCRLLWTYRLQLNQDLLETRLKQAGIMQEWKAFANFVVGYLGMPESYIPCFGHLSNNKKKSRRLLSFIIKTGNFGHNRDRPFYQKYPYLIRKCISLWRNGGDILHHLSLFPCNSFLYLLRFLNKGFLAVAVGD